MKTSRPIKVYGKECAEIIEVFILGALYKSLLVMHPCKGVWYILRGRPGAPPVQGH